MSRVIEVPVFALVHEGRVTEVFTTNADAVANLIPGERIVLAVLSVDLDREVSQ